MVPDRTADGGPAGHDAGDAGRPLQPSADASDAPDASFPPGITLTVNGVMIPVTQSKISGSTFTDFNGIDWITTISAPIENPGQYDWNPSKKELYVEIYDEQSRQTPLAIGDFPCLRGAVGTPTYGFTNIDINNREGNTATSLLSSHADQATCRVHLAAWSPVLRGSGRGFLTVSLSEKIAFEITWNVVPTPPK